MESLAAEQVCCHDPRIVEDPTQHSPYGPIVGDSVFCSGREIPHRNRHTRPGQRAKEFLVSPVITYRNNRSRW